MFFCDFFSFKWKRDALRKKQTQLMKLNKRFFIFLLHRQFSPTRKYIYKKHVFKAVYRVKINRQLIDPFVFYSVLSLKNEITKRKQKMVLNETLKKICSPVNWQAQYAFKNSMILENCVSH